MAEKSWHGSRIMQQCLYVYLQRQLLPWSWRQNRLNVMLCSLASSTYPDLLNVSVSLTWVLALACSRPIILAWKPYIYYLVCWPCVHLSKLAVSVDLNTAFHVSLSLYSTYILDQGFSHLLIPNDCLKYKGYIFDVWCTDQFIFWKVKKEKHYKYVYL